MKQLRVHWLNGMMEIINENNLDTWIVDRKAPDLTFCPTVESCIVTDLTGYPVVGFIVDGADRVLAIVYEASQ